MFSGTKGYRTKPPVGVRLNPLHPLSQGLVGYWLFNEGAGSVAHDISGHGNHGTLNNMSPNTQGSGWGGSKFGGGLNFDGSNDYVDAGNDKSTDIIEPLSISVTVKSSDLTNYQMILDKAGASGSRRQYGLLIFTDGKLQFGYNDGTWRNFTTTNIVITVNTTHHIVVVIHDTTPLTASFYVDGSLKPNTATNAANSLPHTDWVLTIGNSYGGVGGDRLNGIVDPVLLYERALSPAEAKQLYEDPFCNLLRVPVRYAPAVPGGLSIPVAMNYYRRRRVA